MWSEEPEQPSYTLPLAPSSNTLLAPTDPDVSYLVLPSCGQQLP